MSNQTDRLEALLARVQENRQQPRALSGFASTISGTAPAPRGGASSAGHAAPGPAQAAQPERRAEPRAPERAKPAATPLEMAFENSVNVSANAAPARAPNAGAGHGGMTQPLHSAPAPAPREGVMLVDPSPMQPGRPIAQVVSKHPPLLAATFGELLRRSLSLRPR